MKILTENQIRSAEKLAADQGISMAALMKKAAKSAADHIVKNYDVCNKRVLVVCGKGNNGGDGICVADFLSSNGADVELFFPIGLPVSTPATEYISIADKYKKVSHVSDDYDFYIDAIFGIGLSKNPEGFAAMAIEEMNSCNGVKIAIDVPSGVFCNGGRAEVCFAADLTISFIAMKLCFLLPISSDMCGQVHICDLDIDPCEFSYLTTYPPEYIKRRKNTHKGTYGTAFMITGSYGMCGASILAAKAAIRSGVGIVKAVVCDKNYSAFTQSVPEAVTVPVETDSFGSPIVFDKTLLSNISSSNSMLIGCGLGRSEQAFSLVKRALLYSDIPTVIDADGINAVATDINIIRNVKAPVIITPHPAEMARLMNTTVFEIESNRIRYAKEFAVENGLIVVLKGANTIVASPDGKVYFNVTGNPGMATAGSGDVLSGIIATRLAFGENPLEAAIHAVWIHGTAGDLAAEKYGENAMCAGDIIEGLCHI